MDVVPLYDFMVAAVQPRPIALVTTLDEDGAVNAAPFSFFMVGGVNPVSLMFCPNTKANGEDKATLKNIERSSEFVVNVVTRSVVPLVSEGASGSGSQKFEGTAFDTRESMTIEVPRLAAAPVQFECRLFQVIRHGSGGFASVYVIGEVLMIHAEAEIWSDPSILKPVGRLGGPTYVDLDKFEFFVP